VPIVNPKPKLIACYACGASMSEGEVYCPQCRSPRLDPDARPTSKIGLVIVLMIVVLGCVGVVLKVTGIWR
jgi:hypothetical protein